MKYKLLSVRGHKETNIGDYIQALASSQFLPTIDGFVDREKLKSYSDEECAVIMNGWYIHDTSQWPPSHQIHPLFIAVHFNVLAENALFGKESLSYLKAFEPIGCRDLLTCERLHARGIEAYFSGCMTLTLGRKYATKNTNGKVYFVDPYFVTHWNAFQVLKNAIYLFFHFKSISTIAKKYPEAKKGLRKRMILTSFYRAYQKCFTKETLLEAEYICQQSSYYKINFPTDEERLEEAERLVKQYARASLVVTSRIHCALPCLGLETPVIYIEDASQSEASKCRLGGLRELFTIIRWNKNSLIPEFSISGKISKSNKPDNKSNWKPIAASLQKRVADWMNAYAHK